MQSGVGGGKNVTDRLYEHAKAKQMQTNIMSATNSQQNLYYHS